MHVAEQYAHDVLSGKIKTGKLIRLAVERYFRDLENADKKGWFFDKESANQSIEFCKLLNHYKGKAKGTPFVPLPHQQFQFWNIYGWKNKSDSSNRFVTSYEEVARKNGKSTASAARGAYRILVTEQTGAQVFSIATKENQAYIITNDAANLLLSSPGLKDLIYTKKAGEYFTRVITKDTPNSFIRALGRDSKSEDGRHASEIKADEVHAWPDRYLLDVMEESIKGRLNPLIDMTTTAGLPYVSGKDGFCFGFRKVCVDILNQEKEDDSLFIMIHSMDEGDDWEDLENWHKANPSLDQPGCVTLSDLKKEYVKAKNEGEAKLVSFKTKSLNIWTDAPKIWIPEDVWKKGKAPVKERECKWFAGYDGGRTYDFSAWVLISDQPTQKVSKSDMFYAIKKIIPSFEEKFFDKKQGIERTSEIQDFSIKVDSLSKLKKLILDEFNEDIYVGLKDGLATLTDRRNEVQDVIPYYWIPDGTLEQREREDRTTYRDWRAKNYLFATPGNAISKDDIKNWIISEHMKRDIFITNYDPSLFAGEMITSLTEVLGVDKFMPYSQSLWTSNGKGMSPPTKQLEAMLLGGKIRHGGHPILTWNIRNAEILKDTNDNIKIIKGNPKQRVDGAVALVMAVAAYDEWVKKPKISLDFLELS